MRKTMILVCFFVLGCGSGVEEDCWWCGLSSTSDGDKGDDLDEGKEEKEGAFGEWSGEVDASSGIGGFYYAADDCELGYAIEEAVRNDTCVDCDLAFSLTLSAVVVAYDGGGCDVAAGLEGVVIQAGHQEPDTLWFNKEETWYVEESGTSNLTMEAWTFWLGGK